MGKQKNAEEIDLLCRMWKEVAALIRKELLLEWKQKYAFNGLLLYVVSMTVVISLAFRENLSPTGWNILYWLMLLFAAINAVAKSFMAESQGQLRYLYTLARPTAIMLAKFCYNAGLLVLVALLNLLVFAFLGEQEFAHLGRYLALVCLGAVALAANLSLVTAIAAKAEQQTTLLAVLSFPVIVPILLLLIRLTEAALTGLSPSNEADYFAFLLGLTAVLLMLSLVLFPFLWRD